MGNKKGLLINLSVTCRNSDRKVILMLSIKIKTSKIKLKTDRTHQFLKYQSNEIGLYVNNIFSESIYKFKQLRVNQNFDIVCSPILALKKKYLCNSFYLLMNCCDYCGNPTKSIHSED